MIKILIGKETAEFATKEEALKEIISGYINIEGGESIYCILDRAKEEVEAGGSRIIFISDFFLDDHEIGGHFYDEIPQNFFDEKKKTIKALLLGNTYEFKTKEEAIEGLKKFIPEVEEYDDKNHSWLSEDPYEIERLWFNIELIKLGATRVVDINSEIPEGFYA